MVMTANSGDNFMCPLRGEKDSLEGHRIAEAAQSNAKVRATMRGLGLFIQGGENGGVETMPSWAIQTLADVLAAHYRKDDGTMILWFNTARNAMRIFRAARLARVRKLQDEIDARKEAPTPAPTPARAISLKPGWAPLF